MASVFAFAGIGLALVTGWPGGELVDRLGVGIDDGANLNAPSSAVAARGRAWNRTGLPPTR
jgi:hypothetical protein